MTTPNIRPQERNLKLFSVFTGFFVASLLLANVTSSKIFEIGPVTLPGGAIVFPIVFIFGDILTEVYGFSLSRKIIWTGFACQILAGLVYLIVGFLPPASFWGNQAAYDSILGFVPRIVFASIVAYFCGEFCNSFVLSKMKYSAQGKRGLKQAWRFIASTIVGEAVDTIIITTIAFAGMYKVSELVQIGISVYVFKVAFEIIATPISVWFANWVKKVEGVDVIDTPQTTSYSPFVFDSDHASRSDSQTV